MKKPKKLEPKCACCNRPANELQRLHDVTTLFDGQVKLHAACIGPYNTFRGHRLEQEHPTALSLLFPK
jgi:hypothetical protein